MKFHNCAFKIQTGSSRTSSEKNLASTKTLHTTIVPYSASVTFQIYLNASF